MSENYFRLLLIALSSKSKHIKKEPSTEPKQRKVSGVDGKKCKAEILGGKCTPIYVEVC